MANKAKKTRKTRAANEKKIDNLPVALERADEVVGGITCRKAGDKPQEYMTMTLENTLISGYSS